MVGHHSTHILPHFNTYSPQAPTYATLSTSLHKAPKSLFLSLDFFQPKSSKDYLFPPTFSNDFQRLLALLKSFSFAHMISII